MSKSIVLFSLILFFVCGAFSAHASSKVSSMGQSVAAAIDRLPEGASKQGLIRYLQIVSPQAYKNDRLVGTGNQGIQDFLAYHFETNDCYAEAAFRFYRDIKQMNTLSERPHLNDVSGEGGFQKKKKGWLWELALRHTQGNKNKAMALIGLCGHDDINQGTFHNDRVEAKLRAEGWDDEDLFTFDEHLDEYKLCPLRESDFYLPQSLGSGVDISNSLKSQIALTQAEGRAEILPAKYYHVLGAAFLTCQMVEAGLRPSLASSLQELAARAYRGIRLCAKTADEYATFQEMLADPTFQKRPSKVPFDTHIKSLLVRDYLSGACLKDSESMNCGLLGQIYPFMPEPPQEPSERINQIQKIHYFVDRIVAAGLYGSWYLGGHRMLKSLPCTDEQILGPNPMFAQFLETMKININICGFGLSAEGCKNSRKIIETWKVDFTWTVAQHRVGAQFAAANCTRSAQIENSLNHFCTSGK